MENIILCVIHIYRRSLNTYLILDTCNFKMIIGIERFEVEIGLFDYTFGEKEDINLHGVIRLE